MEQKDRIAKLCDEVRKLADSRENFQILQRWQGVNQDTKDVSVTHGASVWHGVSSTLLTKNSIVPFTVDPEIACWSRILGFDMTEYYTNPLCYLENSLKTKLERFKVLKDDSYVTKLISIFIGVNLEPSMFGVPSVYQPDRDPANDSHSPVIHSHEDLDKLKAPDFKTSGIMPLVHRFYSEIRSALPEDFSVAFPIWGRGPWGVAQHLMGFENLMLAVYDDPDMVHRLMSFIVECQKEWLLARASFLGQELSLGVMYNDEVNCRVFSPAMYEEFVFPYETEIADFQNGITYWHSCGDSGPILKFVKKLKNLQMHDVSAWTDWDVAAVELKGTGIALEVRLHPVKDVLFASQEQMRDKLRRLRETFTGLPVTVRADGLQSVTNLKDDLKKICEWSAIANEMLH